MEFPLEYGLCVCRFLFFFFTVLKILVVPVPVMNNKVTILSVRISFLVFKEGQNLSDSFTYSCKRGYYYYFTILLLLTNFIFYF